MSCVTSGWAYQVLTYAGDGNASRTIATSFPLDVGLVTVWVFPYFPAGTPSNYFRSSVMSGTAENGSGGALITAITGFAAAGFSVNVLLNSLNKSYLCIVMRSLASHLTLGNYAGNGFDNRTIASGATLAGALMIVGRSFTYRSVRFTGDSSINLFADPGAVISDGIQDVPAGSFQVGTDNNVNSGALNYSYCYFPGNGNIGVPPTNGITHFKINGTGANLAVTGLGFQPVFVMARPLLAGDGIGGLNDARWRGACTHTGTQSQISGGGLDATQGIRSLDADGFTVGTALSQLGTDFYGFAIEGNGSCGFLCNGDTKCSDGWGQATGDGLPYRPIGS